MTAITAEVVPCIHFYGYELRLLLLVALTAQKHDS